MNDTKILLLDTNIWISYFFPTRADHKTCFQLIDGAIRHDYELGIANHSLTTLFYHMEKKSKAELRDDKRIASHAVGAIANNGAWACLESVLQLATPITADMSDVWLARHMRKVHTDFEDDMVCAAALRCKARYLITNDKALLTSAPVATMSPTAAIEYLGFNNKQH